MVHPLRSLGLTLLGATAAAQLPPALSPPENPTSPAKVVLGKALFWDEQLSTDDSVACGTCHVPEAGGSDPRGASALHPGFDGVFGTEDDVLGSIGVVGQTATLDFRCAGPFGTARQVTGRTAPTNIGAAFHGELFWDGRAGTVFVDPETGTTAIAVGGALESQAVGPILSPVEMGHDGRTWSDVRNKLQQVRPLRLASNLTPDLQTAVQGGAKYPALFRAAFGDPAISAARIAFAIAAYERTLLPDQTPFDAYTAGNTSALSANQVTGMTLFFGAAHCSACHHAPLFSDGQFHNLGLRPAAEDPGRFGQSGVPVELGAFKTPTLRNTGLRPRLFHNGQSPPLGIADQNSDLRSVANVYLRGGGADRSNLDPFLLPLIPQGLNLQDLSRVLDFVQHGLTDPRTAQGMPPFDHPTLRQHAMPPPLRFGPALAGASEPDFVTTAPTFVGNQAWKLGLFGGDGNTVAAVAWSVSALQPAAFIVGIPINVGPDLDYQVFALQGPAGTPGLATWHLAIPDAPALDGLTGYFQLFTLDAVAPAGIGASRGLQLVVH